MRYVEIMMDRPRRLRFDINSLAELEEVTGTSLFTLFSQEQMGIRFLRTFIWGGLRWEDRALTLQQVGDLIQEYLERGGSLAELAQSMTKALELSGLTTSTTSPLTEGKGGMTPP